MPEQSEDLDKQSLLETTLREMVTGVRTQEMNEGYSPSKIKAIFREIIERRIKDYS
jgi:hypothetical protein